MTERSTLNELRASLAPRYDVDCEVGRGGMATVYRAFDTQSDSREVAIKVLLPDLAAAVGAERFRREVAIASTLEHPRILNALDAGSTNDSLYLVMPFVRGESLRDRLKRERQLPVADAVTIAREVADALAYAHARGFVHRDVKPENILLDDGHAIVADFGIARVITQNVDADTLTRTGVAVGTPMYMSPEQSAAERAIDGRSDEYSLGCVLYEMLVGEPPFTGNSTQMLMARHAMEPVPSVRVVRGTVPEHVEDAIYRAMEKAPADRFPTLEAFGKALGDVDDWRYTRPTRARRAGRGARPWWRRRPGRRALLAVGAVTAVAAVAVAGAAAWRQRGAVSGPALPVVTIAVAPFNPLQPELRLWQEGMVDLMSRNLEGAGPVRAVSPAVVLRGWSGKANLSSARALGRRTGARYSLFGEVNSTAGGGVHMKAELVDVVTDSVSAAFERTGTEVSALADSLTLFVLGEVAKKYPVGAVRRVAPFSGVAITALKPFLEGEQAYRRTAWVEALAAYTRATALDTGFALALHRTGQILSWQRAVSDSTARAYWLRAGAANHGLAPRDSMLLLADSLSAALANARRQVPDWTLVRRLFATVNEAVARYPNDPEVWFTVGEARMHHGYGSVTDVSEKSTLDAFDRAIALDSGFAPAYIHAVALSFRLQGRESGRRHARAYLVLQPTESEADAIRLVDALTDPLHVDSSRVARTLDTVSTDALYGAVDILDRWPDSAQAAIALIRSVGRRPSTGQAHVDDSLFVQQYLPLTLAYRGRLHEAYDALGDRPAQLLVELALLGVIGDDSASAIFARWRDAHAPRAWLAMPWWSAHGDSASLRAIVTRADSAAKADTGEAARLDAYHAVVAGAFLALTRRTTSDSSRALDALLRMSDTVCLGCFLDRQIAARVLVARGRDAEAAAILRQRLYTVISPSEIAIALEHGRVAARLGRTEEAAAAFSLVVQAWANGDREVQPAVEEARAALGRAGTVAADPAPTPPFPNSAHGDMIAAHVLDREPPGGDVVARPVPGATHAIPRTAADPRRRPRRLLGSRHGTYAGLADGKLRRTADRD